MPWEMTWSPQVLPRSFTETFPPADSWSVQCEFDDDRKNEWGGQRKGEAADLLGSSFAKPGYISYAPFLLLCALLALLCLYLLAVLLQLTLFSPARHVLPYVMHDAWQWFCPATSPLNVQVFACTICPSSSNSCMRLGNISALQPQPSLNRL